MAAIAAAAARRARRGVGMVGTRGGTESAEDTAARQPRRRRRAAIAFAGRDPVDHKAARRGATEKPSVVARGTAAARRVPCDGDGGPPDPPKATHATPTASDRGLFLLRPHRAGPRA